MLRPLILTAALLGSSVAATVDASRAANATTAYINALNTTYAVLHTRTRTSLTAEQLTRAVKPGVQLGRVQHTLARALLAVRILGQGNAATIEAVCRATGVTVARAQARTMTATVTGRCTQLP